MGRKKKGTISPLYAHTLATYVCQCYDVGALISIEFVSEREEWVGVDECYTFNLSRLDQQITFGSVRISFYRSIETTLITSEAKRNLQSTSLVRRSTPMTLNGYQSKWCWPGDQLESVTAMHTYCSSLSESVEEIPRHVHRQRNDQSVQCVEGS